MTDDPFVAHRNLLFTVAYEMLGSAAIARCTRSLATQNAVAT